MIEDNRYDVLIVGARCAGATTAMLLAGSGLRVLAIDRGAYGSDTLSTHALMRGGVMLLQRWGIMPALLRRGTPPVRRTTFHYAEDAVAVDIRPDQDVSALYAPRRTVLDAALVEAAWEAGAEVRFGVSLLDLVRRDDGRVTGAVVQDASGQRTVVHADLVIGADGLSSAVARMVEAPLLHAARHACAVVFAYLPGIAPDGYHWYFNRGVSAGVIPTNDGRHCVFAAMPPARFRADVRGDLAGGFRRVLVETSPALAEAVPKLEPDTALHVFAGRRGFIRQSHGPGWALVGDAGYFKDPLTAHGITDALRDSALLAQAVVQGTEAALREQHDLRMALSLPLFRVSDDIASFDWDLETVQRHHKALNAAMKQEAAYLAAMPVWPDVAVSVQSNFMAKEKAA